MVRGTFFGVEIGKTGLTTAQFGLDVTGHNISNLDTDGFTRQRIVSTAHDPFSTVGRFAPVGQGLVGGGVRVQILDQIRSAYLDRRFREETSTHAYWDTRAQSLSYIESFFDNVNEKTSINHSMAEFFRSMTVVAQDPVAGAPRTLMQTTAMDLVQQLNSIYQGLIDFQSVENRAVITKTNDINRMAQDISDLNVAIYTFELTGMIANDLRDKRNLLLDELSRYADIQYREYPDQFGHSMMEVKLAGSILVDHDRINELSIAWEENVLGPDEPKVAIPFWKSWAPDNYNPDDPDNNELADEILASARLDIFLKAGELKAHLDMRDGIEGGVDSTQRGIPYYIERINDLARALVIEVNQVHAQGWSDHPDGSRTGILFFDNLGFGDVRVGEVRYYDAAGVRVMDPESEDIVRAEYFVDPDDPNIKLITAKNIMLSKDIQDNAFNIAASSAKIGLAGTGTPIELQRHNNENMKKLYALFGRTNFTVQGRPIGSFDEFGTTIRFDVGNTLHTAKQAAETSRILTHAANNQRTAVAGVSLDEEMVGLVKYNHAYNGASRVITAMDDALDRLINGTGRVGL